MPDPNPPVPANDPIPLKDLVQSFASTVAATSHNLDQASVDLRNLYENSGNATLAMMLPPRFTLDEVIIDLSFVVVQATPEVYGDALPPEDGKIAKAAIAPDDADNLRKKLVDLAETDAQADAESKSKAMDAQILAMQTSLQSGVTALQNANAELQKTQADMNRARSNPLALPQFAIRLQQQAAQAAALNAQFGPNGTVTTQVNRALPGLLATKKSYDDATTLLSGKDPLTPDELDQVKKAGIAYTPLDALWDSFYQKYLSMRDLYASMVKAFQAKAALPRSGDYTMSADDNLVVQKILGMPQGSGWTTIQKKVAAIQADYNAVLAALNALVRLVASIKGSGLLVRVDPKAVGDAPVEARQKIHLAFHTQVRQNVKVGDEEVAING